MIQVESARARALGWIAAALGTAGCAALLLTLYSELYGERDAVQKFTTYFLFYLPGLCVSAIGLATGLVARPLGPKEGAARREAVIGIILSTVAIVGLLAARRFAAWFVGASS